MNDAPNKISPTDTAKSIQKPRISAKKVAEMLREKRAASAIAKRSEVTEEVHTVHEPDTHH